MPPSPRKFISGVLTFLLILLGFAAGAPAASAVTLTVDSVSDGSGGGCSPIVDCTLREAIELAAKGEEANAEINGDVNIEFDIEGEIDVVSEYKIRAGEGVDSVTIDGFGGVTLDGNEHGRVFSAEGDVTISGLEVVSGKVAGIAVDGDGGAALLVSGGDVTLERVHFSNNQIESVRAGGAIDVEGGDLTIIDSTIFENTSEDAGGGINVDSSGSTLTLRNTWVMSNVAQGVGGGIYQDEGNLVVSEDSAISTNHADGSHGGGIAAEPDGSHTTTIVESTILGNMASGSYGGGIVADTGSGGLTIEKSTISGNTGSYGGGIAANGPTTIELSTVAENAGGGLYADSADVFVRSSTIAGNESSDSSGGGIRGGGEELVVRDSIVAENTGPGGVAEDCAAEVISEGHNILGVTGGECDWPPAEEDRLGVDPELGELRDNGGPTQTMAPIHASSPAINQGGNPTATDQRGDPRPVPAGAEFSDIGAVEVQAPVSETAPGISPATGLEEGDELSCEAGTWDNDTIIDPTYSYAWLLDGTPVESGPTYTLTAGDVGKNLSCQVTADNGVTTTAATSPAVQLQPGALALEPASHDFGDRNVGAGPSASQGFVVKNEGGASVTVGEVKSSDATQFPVEGTDCEGETLAPGQQCTVEVRFMPTAPGGKSATLSVESDVGTVNASLEGTGTLAAIAVSPDAYDFGSQRIDSGPSEAQVFEVGSSGTGPVTIGASSIVGPDSAQFTIPVDGDECVGKTLEPGEQCTVEVVFDPTTTGQAVATLAVPSDSLTASVDLSGMGTVGVLSVTPIEFDFGSRPIDSGPSALKVFEVSSTGSAAVTLGTASVSAEFEIPAGGDECSGETLQPTESCTVKVVFDPAELGLRSGTLSLPSDGPTASAQLSGNGVSDPAFAVDVAEVDFGAQQVGTTTVQTVTLSNGGGVAASVESVAIVGIDVPFSLPAGGDGCSGAELPPGGTCSIEVAFSPNAVGDASATLRIEGNAPSSAVPLSGTGVASGTEVPKPTPPASLPQRAVLAGSTTLVGNAAGAVRTGILCVSPSGASCEVTLALTGAGGGTSAGWSGTVAPGPTPQPVELALPAATRKAMGRKGTVAAQAVVSAVGGEGVTVPITLRAPKAPALTVRSAKPIGGAVRFSLSCGGYLPRCRGRLTLTAQHRPTKLAGGEVSLAKGGAKRTLALTAAGRRLLEAEPGAQLLAKLTTRDSVYERRTRTRARLRLVNRLPAD